MGNKRIAASIEYSNGDNAPRLTAYGEGPLADRLLEIAAKAGVPLYREEELAVRLGSVGIGKEIPPELYKIVAEVLSFIYLLDYQKGDENDDLRQVNR
ncbi:MAG: EscU/YscU/HrcU family type III secretion system export apparatus switch protein [Bacillota bacterium]|jgi:flagellar biosynthesis protein|nr:EscU/YscU/HrcU family type III secretion system export apparatus switch protein [Bacillota bacterium]MDD3297476.1 EscU/YscU/HrcU family type III secretion system export apparatus switch protein [Bacillota bacterium]MDD3850149.1 EscU/YscU/HrcU family type III secretion system export apparatus switch protein [Bacillota bacterium]MDD4706872.1 EscU/YscU/HrcU family type III secretion system export apparatus switch protein [Bacillota bacterium]